MDFPDRNAFFLDQGRPNPFTDIVEMKIKLPHALDVVVQIYDVQGRSQAVLADRQMSSGIHTISWDGRDTEGRAVPSGIYFAKLGAGLDEDRRRLVLLR